MEFREVRIKMYQKLKDTRKPFACRVADIMGLESVSNEQLIRTMTDCIIELEKLKDSHE